MNKRHPSLTPLLSPPRYFICAGTLPDSEKAKVETYYPPPSEEKAAAEEARRVAEEKAAAVAEEKATALAEARAGGYPTPEEALRAFAESVGMSVDAMWDGVTRGDGGEIVEIDWRHKDLKGTLPVGDIHMPYLRRLDLYNKELKGDIGTLVLPEGMQHLNLSYCTGLTGDIGTFVLPEGMQIMYLNGCRDLTGKAES